MKMHRWIEPQPGSRLERRGRQGILAKEPEGDVVAALEAVLVAARAQPHIYPEVETVVSVIRQNIDLIRAHADRVATVGLSRT